jgi:hypothetical protein
MRCKMRGGETGRGTPLSTWQLAHWHSDLSPPFSLFSSTLITLPFSPSPAFTPPNIQGSPTPRPSKRSTVLARVFRRRNSGAHHQQHDAPRPPPTPALAPAPASSTLPSPVESEGSGARGGRGPPSPTPALRSHPIGPAVLTDVLVNAHAPVAAGPPVLASHPLAPASAAPPLTRLPRAPPPRAPPPLPKAAVKALVTIAMAKAIALADGGGPPQPLSPRAAHGAPDDAATAVKRLVRQALSRAAAAELGAALGPPHLSRVARDKLLQVAVTGGTPPAVASAGRSPTSPPGPTLAEALGAPRTHRLAREVAAWAAVPRRSPAKVVR